MVEDDALVAQALVTLLERMGGEVDSFPSAEGALGNTDIKDVDYVTRSDVLIGLCRTNKSKSLSRHIRLPPIVLVCDVHSLMLQAA